MASPSAIRSSENPEADHAAATMPTVAENATLPASAARRAAVVRNPPAMRKRKNVNVATGEPSSRPRRDRGPNWNLQEMLALIDAKRAEYLEELDSVDGRDLMDPDNKKWERISKVVMAAGFSPCPRDHAMCKGKWNSLLADYRRISDYHGRSGTNAEIYWSQSTRQHVDEGLPKTFSQAIFLRIHQWFGRRPQIQPPHIRDTLNPSDGNLKQPIEHTDGGMEAEHDKVHEQSDGDDISASASDGQWLGCPTGMSPSAGPQEKTPSAHMQAKRPAQIPQPSPQGHGNPILISSTETGGQSCRRKPGNTGVRRKTSAAHAALVEATKSTGEVMITQMQAMVGATRETESNRLAVQMSLFEEKMLYQREKDRRLYEQGLMAAENARLAIIKQGELVECLSQISQVLSVGLKVSQPKKVQEKGKEIAKDKTTSTYEDAPKADSNNMAVDDS